LSGTRATPEWDKDHVRVRHAILSRTRVYLL